jgi:hypothetical protein
LAELSLNRTILEEIMFRAKVIAAALGLVFCGASAAEAAKYCAAFVGGPEMKSARSQCKFSSLTACRESIRNRGGGHCYKSARLR